MIWIEKLFDFIFGRKSREAEIMLKIQSATELFFERNEKETKKLLDKIEHLEQEVHKLTLLIKKQNEERKKDKELIQSLRTELEKYKAK